MAPIATSIANKPAWIDLASSDPAASRDFYSKLFGWQVEVNPDPQYGGYALARIDGHDVAGIGPKMMPEAPTAWAIYIGTDDIATLTNRVLSAGGQVISPPMAVGEMGQMAVFADPAGAFISAWQPSQMRGFTMSGSGSLGWIELAARGIDGARSFYEKVFGWKPREASMGADQPAYTEFLVGQDSIAGGMEMNPSAPPDVPSYWLAYFMVDDVDAAYRRATELGAREMMPPTDFSGGRFAVMTDPQGAVFGILKV